MVKKNKNLTYYEAIGRRKTAIARVRLYLAVKGQVDINNQKIKKGDMVVNFKPIKDYFKLTTHKQLYTRPFILTNTIDRFAVSAKINGGGIEGQLEAYILAVSRALKLVDETNRTILKKEGFLTTDARVRERRKVGTGGKARRKKQSPKR